MLYSITLTKQNLIIAWLWSSLAFALLLAPLFYFQQDQQLSKLQQQIKEIAQMLSQQVMPALEFSDKDEAKRIMQALRHIPFINYAELRDDKGYLFAVFQNEEKPLIRPRYLEIINNKVQFWRQHQQLNLNYPINNGSQQYGLLYIQTKLNIIDKNNQTWFYFLICLALLLQLFFIPLRVWGQYWQLKPIYQLIDLFDKINQQQKYQLPQPDPKHSLELQQLQKQIYTFLAQYKNLQEVLNNSEQQAEAANVTKSKFLMTISNEIRSPMNGVLGITELLLEGELTQQQQELGHIIHDSGTKLLSILNDISEYSKIEAGQLSLYISQFNLQVFLKNLVNEFTVKAQAKNIAFHFLQRDELPDLIRGDESRLQRILHHHLTNALKFTHEGEINFQIYIAKENQTQLELGFSIRDTGVGIDRKTLEHLFQVFPESDSRGERKYGGTGLPLIINKKICQMMGGDIHCHSITGDGTTFQITVKLSKLEPEQNSYTQDISYQYLKGLKIILILPISESQILQHYLQKWMVKVTVLSQKKGLEKQLKTLITQKQNHICIYNQEMIEGLNKTLKDIITEDALVPIFSFIRLQYIQADPTDKENSCILNYPLFPKTFYRDIKRLYLKVEKESQWYSISNQISKKSAYYETHVLLVENNVINQQIAKLYLNKLKCSVDILNSADEALTCLNQAHSYDLVFINCSLFKETGFEIIHDICEKNKQIASDKYLPVIGLIPRSCEKNRLHCLEAGIDDCLNKPFNKTQLKQMLDKWL